MSTRGRSTSRTRGSSRSLSTPARGHSETPVHAIADDLHEQSGIDVDLDHQYPRRFKFNPGDFPEGMLVKSSITFRDKTHKATDIIMDLNLMGPSVIDIIERTWPSSQPPGEIDWFWMARNVTRNRTRYKTLVAHLGGTETSQQCTACVKGKVFNTCRINPLWQSQFGACTSCSWNGYPKSCSFHPGKLYHTNRFIRHTLTKSNQNMFSLRERNSKSRQHVEYPRKVTNLAHKPAPASLVQICPRLLRPIRHQPFHKGMGIIPHITLTPMIPITSIMMTWSSTILETSSMMVCPNTLSLFKRLRQLLQCPPHLYLKHQELQQRRRKGTSQRSLSILILPSARSCLPVSPNQVSIQTLPGRITTPGKRSKPHCRMRLTNIEMLSKKA